MKTFLLKFFFVTALFALHSNLHAEQTFTMTSTQINTIANENMRHSDQIRLSFDQAVDIDYTIDEENHTCVILLFNLPLANATNLKLAQKIKNSSKNIKNVTLSKIINPKTSLEGTQISIGFSEEEIHINIQNFESPHQLIIDIVSKSRLFSKINQNTVISHAFNASSNAHYKAQMHI